MTRFLLLVLFFYSMRASAVLDWTEVQIPMSDGQSLAADYYLPEDWTSGPVILIQTPYNKNLVHLFGLPLGVGYAQETSPYAFVILDWRGRFGSIDAAYVGSPTTGEDGFDAVEWVASQTWCDGNIGTWGPSALGRVQYETARQHPPHLKCIAPARRCAYLFL
jgi:putative CocE/NonD family hydrolase